MRTLSRQWLVILGDLVAFWKVRVEVLLAVKLGVLVYLAVKCQACCHRLAHSLCVENRQGALRALSVSTWLCLLAAVYSVTSKGSHRVCQTHRTHVGVWLTAVLVFAGAESLGLGVELDVTLDADDGLKASLQQALL